MKRDLQVKTLFISLISVGIINTLTPNEKLDKAIVTGDTKAIRKLIKKGNADVNAITEHNLETPLILAARLEKSIPYQPGEYMWQKRKNADEKMALVTVELLKLGASPTAQDIWGMTALMWAARNDARKVLRTLLNKKRGKVEETINIQDNEGNTALIHAVRDIRSASGKDFIEVVKTLLLNGADPNIMNNIKRSALTYAALNNKLVIMGLLIGFGAKKPPTIDQELISNEAKEIISPTQTHFSEGGPDIEHPYLGQTKETEH